MNELKLSRSLILKSERIKYNIRTKDIAENLSLMSTSVSYLEKNIDKNNTFKYLRFLRSNGIDLNTLFEKLYG